VDVFAENEIDFDALPHVTEEDLKEIGIALGARRKLIAAVAQLISESPSEPELTSDSTRDVGAEAERRQLTVMFCDLAEYTALSERLDPEDLREILSAYHETCSEIVTQYDGHIAKYIGDGLLVYFGYPQAHEDDPQRAVRAGLEIVVGVANLGQRFGGATTTELAVHLGIHTGLVVVGEMGAGSTREETAIVGETPNIAARLEGLAEPGRLLISESTYSLTEGLFICEALGSQSLKGITVPVNVYSVKRETDARSRFEVAARRGLMPLVGREQEIALLLDRWEQAKEGEGQVVLLSGEAGIGKSRIVRMLRDRVAAEDPVRLRYQCSPYHTNSALYPIIDQLERASGFARDDTSDIKLDKLRSLLEQSLAGSTESISLLAALLSIPTEGHFAPLELSPDQQKERTLAALIDQMDGLMKNRSALMIFEDAHWIDPTTQELLNTIVDRTQWATALIVITHRPVFTAPWGGHPNVTSLTLNRLSRRQSQEMINTLTANKPLPTEVLNQILAKTDGVPLFIEELTKAVLEGHLLEEERDRYVLTAPLPPLAIPATLHDSLVARLDRLSPIKEIAQTAAAIGREFSYEILSAVSGASDDELGEALDQLAEAELIFRRGIPPHAFYTFKHALVRDAAYESLLKAQRKDLHSRIARVLKESFADRIAAEPELLAHHYNAAGETGPAIDSWLDAGERATQRSANTEAIAHLRQGLDLIPALPEGMERARRELQLQIAIGSPLMALESYGSQDLEKATARACQLCEEVGDSAQLLPLLYRQTAHQLVQGNLRIALSLAEEFLRTAEQQDDDGPALVAHRIIGFIQYTRGELSQSRRALERTLELYVHERHAELAYKYGQDTQPPALAVLSIVLHLLGYSDQASRMRDEAIARADEIGHAMTLGYAKTFATCVLGAVRRDWQVIRNYAPSILEFTEDEGLLIWNLWTKYFHSLAMVQADPTEPALAGLGEIRKQIHATGTLNNRTFHLALHAELLAAFGQTDKAVGMIDEALDLVEAHDEHWWQAEILRLKGGMTLDQGNESEADAEALFQDAIAVARRQSAKSLELRAAISLARLWKDQQKHIEACELLEPLYDWFTEGFHMPDMIEAKALLKELKLTHREL
jgi:predicted ATPase/class 3 adenylate cyclase